MLLEDRTEWSPVEPLGTSTPVTVSRSPQRFPRNVCGGGNQRQAGGTSGNGWFHEDPSASWRSLESPRQPCTGTWFPVRATEVGAQAAEPALARGWQYFLCPGPGSRLPATFAKGTVVTSRPGCPGFESGLTLVSSVTLDK